MEQTIKAVLFDLDGTLLDTLEDLRVAVNVALAERDLPPRTLPEIQSFVGNGMKLLVELALPETASEAEVSAAFDTFFAYYQQHMTVYTRPYDGVLGVMQALRARGIRVGVVSNKKADAVKELCAQYFGDTVEAAEGEREGVRRKPAPDGVFAMLDLWNIPLEQAVLVGDSTVDCETAAAAGLDFYGVTWGFCSREQLQNAGATRLYATADELLTALEQRL